MSWVTSHGLVSFIHSFTCTSPNRFIQCNWHPLNAHHAFIAPIELRPNEMYTDKPDWMRSMSKSDITDFRQPLLISSIDDENNFNMVSPRINWIFTQNQWSSAWNSSKNEYQRRFHVRLTSSFVNPSWFFRNFAHECQQMVFWLGDNIWMCNTEYNMLTHVPFQSIF